MASAALLFFDTGASVVPISAEDASIGIPINALNYSIRLTTANAIAHAAPVAKKGTLRASLLGQTFLEKLKSYDVKSNRVTLPAR